MSNLGSIYGDDDPAGPRGRDLSATVEVPRSRLGAPWVVDVPLELPDDGNPGTLVRRAIGPGEKGPSITLNLPRDVPAGVRLRLRGQGESIAQGRPGDLHLEVVVVDTEPDPGSVFQRYLWWLVPAAAVAAGLAMWWVL